MDKKLVYVSGKYSGDIETNIATARKVAITLWEAGLAVICPHLNTINFEQDSLVSYDDFINGDLRIVEGVDMIVMLPNWEESKGAKLELEHAVAKGIPVHYLTAVDGDKVKASAFQIIAFLSKKKESIAVEAENIVNGARRNHYGSPLDNHTRTAEFWTTYATNVIAKKGKLTAEDVCYLNILQKVARSIEKDKRDNGTDIVGYAMNVEIIKEARKEEW